MSEKLLQINFNFNVSREEYEQAVNSLADDIANVQGLVWKIWIMNEEQNESGGWFLFENQSTLDDYLASELTKKITSHPALSNFSVKTYSIMDKLTEITRGPVKDRLKV